MRIDDLVRENIRNLKPFSSARSEFSGVAEVLLDANESPYDTHYNRYPDPHQKELKQIIARHWSIHPGQIILGNGSDEIIDLIVRTFCRPSIDKVRYIDPSFGMYEVVADINDVHKEAILLDEGFDLNVEACLKDQDACHKLLFLCSPNNPTGNLLSEDRITKVIKGWAGIVVLDEAYIEYSGRKSFTDQLGDFKNLIILQTFSKARGGAGLRLGMGFASKEIISYINKIKPPYNVNIHTQQKAIMILEQQDVINMRIQSILSERKRVKIELEDIKGIELIYPSDSNFLLVRCREHLGLYHFLCEQGVIVRDRSKLHGCQSCLRITIGLPKENELMLDSVRKYYA